jgi:hypothetical protein
MPKNSLVKISPRLAVKCKNTYCDATYLLVFLITLSLLIPTLSGCAQKHLQSTHLEENTHVKITGCYSDLFYHEESGDILGWEFFIVYSGVENFPQFFF